MAQRPVYQNVTLYIPDIAREKGLISGVEFENCELLGPAILVLIQDCDVSHVAFEIGPNGPDSILWEVAPEELPKLGVIGLQDCRIVGGSTANIGFAGTHQELEMIRRSLPPWPPKS